MPTVEEEIIARLDGVIDALPADQTSYEMLRHVGPFPPRHVSAIALRRVCELEEYGGAGAAGVEVARYTFDHTDSNLQQGVETGIVGRPGDCLPQYATYFDISEGWDNAPATLYVAGDDPDQSFAKCYLWQPSYETRNVRQENSALLSVALTFKTVAPLMLRVEGVQATGAATLVAVIARAAS